MAGASIKIAQILAGNALIAGGPQVTGTDMGEVMRSVVLASTIAPRFDPDQAPLEDGRAYTATDGQTYARKELGLATRPGAFPGPDVQFLKELDGTVHLHVGLEDRLPAGVPAGTVLLGEMSGVPPRIVWAQGTFDLPMPTPYTDATSGMRRQRILARLTPEQVAALFAAMSQSGQGAHLVIDHRFAFRQVVRPPNGRPRPLPLPDRRELPEVVLRDPFSRGGMVTPFAPQLVEAPVLMNLMPLTMTVDAVALPMLRPSADLIAVTDLQIAELVVPIDVLDRIKHRRGFDDVIIIPTGPDPVANEDLVREVAFSRQLPFFFDPLLDQNTAVFRAISGSGSMEPEWQDTEWGTIRPSEFVNTVHLLPHEIRLSYDAARGLPHMMPVHYQSPDGSRRLRVLLRAEPWYDPSRVAMLQAALSRQTAGSYMHPRIIAGGIASARLSLRTVFPEDIEMPDGDTAEIDLRAPFDLTLDLSEEFYALLVTILTGPVGLTGTVVAVLTAATDTQEAATRVIPVALTFQRIGAPPLDRAVVSAPINPSSVALTNRAAHEITITEASASMLMVDANALLPASVLPAQVTATLPLRLAPGGRMVVSFEAQSTTTGIVWNALDAALGGMTLDIDPQAALRAVHALAPATTLGWKLRVLSPQLGADQSATPDVDRLLAVEVQMRQADGPMSQITLMGGELTFTFPRSLDDLASANDAVAFLTLTVQVRGVYPNGRGDWSAAAPNTGDTLFVFVPPRVPGGGS